MTNLYREIDSLLSGIPSDFGGGCSVRKATLLAWLIRMFDLSHTLDIGVYRGRSFFPQAYAHSRFTGGLVYGVDPWESAQAKEHDNVKLGEQINQWSEESNLDSVYQQVVTMRQKLRLEHSCFLLRMTSVDAFQHLSLQHTVFGLIHIDGNHDTHNVMQDVNWCIQNLTRNGFIVLDDTSWTSVEPAYQVLQSHLNLVYRSKNFPQDDYAIFWAGSSSLRRVIYQIALNYADHRLAFI